MPNLRTRLRERGAHFPNHVAAQPVCGPSRASFLSGRFPHNVGYVNNVDRVSYKRYLLEQNNSVGTWLTAAGYDTSFFGKYVNGLESNPPSGWSFWGGLAAQTYSYYDSTQWQIPAGAAAGTPVSRRGTHQADFLASQAAARITAAAAARTPFFVSLTPLMVHWGSCYREAADQLPDDPFFEMGHLPCADPNPLTGGAGTNCTFATSACPTVKNKHAFDGVPAPHVPSWNATASGRLPPAMQGLGISPWAAAREDMAFRNRSAALLDLDALIGTVLDAVDAAGVADNTWVFFTSDNGYHLGEHGLASGKEHPYNTDVSLPFYVRGPGLPANTTLAHASTHVDITATIVELAGAVPVGAPLDGKSLVGALGPAPVAPADWREYQFSEFFGGSLTWWKVRYPANQSEFHWWCDGPGGATFPVGTPEVFFYGNDTWELTDLAGVNGTAAGIDLVHATLPLAAALGVCGGDECNRAPRVAPNATQPLKCYTLTPLEAGEVTEGATFDA
jgi:N-acetylglucosamine-6-sulfatase